MEHLVLVRQKRYITLIEIMIVMFLIALIAGVVAYNYRGSLDEGRAFQTNQNAEKVRNILELELAKQRSPDYSALSGDGWKALIRGSSLIKDANSTMRDGWGNDLVVQFYERSGTFSIASNAAYFREHPDKCPATGQ
jgi:general secretion pathway protein G